MVSVNIVMVNDNIVMVDVGTVMVNVRGAVRVGPYQVRLGPRFESDSFSSVKGPSPTQSDSDHGPSSEREQRRIDIHSGSEWVRAKVPKVPGRTQVRAGDCA
eukprot:gene11507-biopygen9347